MPCSELSSPRVGGGAAVAGLHTNQLEDLLMKSHRVSYRVARKIVLDSRETLGMSKYEPWTDELRDASERLFHMRYPHGFPASSGAGDDLSNSNGTPGTLQSFSFEDHNKDKNLPGSESTDEPTETEAEINTDGGKFRKWRKKDGMNKKKGARRNFFAAGLGLFRLRASSKSKNGKSTTAAE